MVRQTLLVLAATLLAAAAADAEFYRWQDREGREFYTNDPEKIPHQYRSQAVPMEVREERVNVVATPPDGSPPDAGPAGHRDRNGRGEQYWRKRAANLRREIRKMEGEREAVVRRIEEREQPGKKGGTKGSASLTRKKIRLEKDIARKQRELDVELPEEARKAEAYPGWLRE